MVWRHRAQRRLEECGKGLVQDDCATLAAAALEEIIAAIDDPLCKWELR